MADKADWSKMKPLEMEKLVLDIAKKETSLAKIGLILRDQHGIPKAKLLGLKIKKIIDKNKIEVSTEQKELQEKIENLKKHFGKNKHDYTAQRKAVMYASRLKKVERLSAN